MPDRSRVAAILAGLAPADRDLIGEQLAAFEAPWQRRAQRLDQRDALVREMAALFADRGSGRAVASAVHDELARSVASGRRKRTAAPSLERELAECVLALNGGAAMGVRQLRRVLAGLRSLN
jgi:hypothetical protein